MGNADMVWPRHVIFGELPGQRRDERSGMGIKLLHCCRLLVCCLLVMASPLQAGPQAGDRQAGQESRQAAEGADPWMTEEASAVLYRPVETKTDDLGRETRQIRVLVHYGRTEFFVANGKPWGVEYEAFSEYEKFLNRARGKHKPRTRITFIPVRFDDLIPFLVEGKGDIAAGLLTVTDERKQKVSFTDAYLHDVTEVLVRHAHAPPVKSVEELSGKKVHVLKGSSFAQHLRELNERFLGSGRAPVTIVEMPPSTNADDILEMVNAGIFQFTVVDNFVADLWEQVLPDIRVARGVTVSNRGSIAWAVRRNNPELLASLNEFILYGRQHLKKRIGQVMRAYFKDTKFIKNPLKQELFGRVKEVAPHFKDAAATNKFDWLMVMAQGYQESELNQKLRSPRGAIGVMQLLPSTAKSVGYRDITTERTNIAAGAAYLNWIRKNYFNEPDIPPDARVDFALAAYNAGAGRVEALRQEAKRRGLNPNIWFNNVERVALDKIGEEPVRYVGNINRYYIAYRMSEQIEKERDQVPAKRGQ